MPKPKIDINKLDQMLRDGKPQKEIAQVFDVTEGAISKAKKQLKSNIVRIVGLEKANEVVESHLDMMGQLRKINSAINDELDRAREEMTNANGKNQLAFQEIIIKLSAEIRKQLEAQLRIVEIWHDHKVIAEFQKEILDILDEMAPGTRNETIKRLKQRKTLRGLVSFN